MKLSYSFVIPVFNRPDEIQELLESMVALEGDISFEVVIVEDGSSIACKSVVERYQDRLNVAYFEKGNEGPGPSRNYGMRKALGDYFIILDSDCILPNQYLNEVDDELLKSYVDFYGGPDGALDSFSDIQKAINYAMTSVFSTGGIRGGKKAVDTFQPRSFNLGISRDAFIASGGFGKIHPGEDPDLTLRLWSAGFHSRLFPKAFVYHKRRISWSKFYKQVHKFGLVRPILNNWHQGSSKVTYWFPTVFCVGLLCAAVFSVFGFYLLLYLYGLYFSVLFFHSIAKTSSVKLAVLAIYAVLIQFIAYGYGFLKGTFFVKWLKRDPHKQFPHLFFD